MSGSRHQNTMDKRPQIQGDQHVVLNSTRSHGQRTGQRATDLAKEEMNVQMEYNPHTDVMFVDLCPVNEGDRVDTFDVGEMLQFPGQIQVRINRQKRMIYGITIQNYSGFRRKLVWRYHTLSVRRALWLIVTTLMAGLMIDSGRQPALSCS